MKMKPENKNIGENAMREARIVKIVLSVAGTADKLEKGVKLLGMLSGMKPMKVESRKRIPNLGVRPGLETGAKVTIRKNIAPLLKRLLAAVDNELKEKQFVENHFSFGIHEYIEIPGTEYSREIGVLGLNVTVDFERKGKRIERRKIKEGKSPKKQAVTREEIMDYMKNNFQTVIKSGKKEEE